MVPEGDKAEAVEKYRVEKQSAKGELPAELAKCIMEVCEPCLVEGISYRVYSLFRSGLSHS